MDRDLEMDERDALADFDDDVDFEEYEAELDEQLENLEAHVRAARLAGA